MKTRKVGAAFLLTTVFLCALACSKGDPRRELLEARAAWTVEPTSWVASDDGTVTVGVRVSGPARSPLSELTFRIQLLDAEGASVVEAWKTIPLSEVPQGSLVERPYRLDSGGVEIDAVSVDAVLLPTAEQESNIPELAGLPAS